MRFAKAVYVLHAFQKKSKRGAATPKTDLDLIDRPLNRAKEDYGEVVKKREADIPVTESSGNVAVRLGGGTMSAVTFGA